MWSRSVLLLALVSLTACSDGWFGEKEPPPLPGTRISVLATNQTDVGKTSTIKVEIDNAASTDTWAQTGGDAHHQIGNIEFGANTPKKKWSVDIGQGSTKSNPLTAQPIIANGRIYALDTKGYLAAFDVTNGKKIWTVFVGNKREGDAVIGGGMAVANGILFVTNGFADVRALSAENGREVWHSVIPGPARAAPTFANGRVYATTIDSRVVALDANDGKQIWLYRGVGTNAGLLGAAAPAVDNMIVAGAFSSGDIVALRIENGSSAWTDNLAPLSNVGGVDGITDIHALPILDHGAVIVMSYAGRMAVIDARSGERIWQRNIGGKDTPVISGNSIFVLSKDDQLMALSRVDGTTIWTKQLAQFKNPAENAGAIVYTGPVLAGGRLIVADMDGHMMIIDPQTGDQTGSFDVRSGPVVPMIIAHQTLYILDRDGTLSAWE